MATVTRQLKDKAERRHRRTWRHPECVATMAAANFDAVPSLAVAMGLECPHCGQPVSDGHHADGRCPQECGE